MLVTSCHILTHQVVGHSYIVYGPLIQGCATVPLGSGWSVHGQLGCRWVPCMSGTLWRETSWPGPLLTNSHVSLKGSQGHHVAIYWPLPIHLMMLLFVHVLICLVLTDQRHSWCWSILARDWGQSCWLLSQTNASSLISPMPDERIALHPFEFVMWTSCELMF